MSARVLFTALILAALCGPGGCGQPDRAAPAGGDGAAYEAEMLSRRRQRDEQYRSTEWSPLAVVALAHLDRDRTTIGAGPGVDLELPGEGVAGLHAVISREVDADGEVTFLLRAVDGEVWSDDEPARPIAEAPLEPGDRVRMGAYLVYADVLGTFGAVVRALDFTSPAYTEFDGLEYFPPDISYRVVSIVTPYDRPELVRVIDTMGWERPAWRYGTAALELQEKNISLVLLTWEPDPGPDSSFFIAFTDGTSGVESYPACRYLQPDFVPGGELVLDFNLATNPSCAYNEGFACPLPPRENRLSLPIRAGEKIYRHHD